MTRDTPPIDLAIETRRFFCFLLALFYKRAARRVVARRYRSLIFKSRPHIVVLFLDTVMIQNGINLITSGGNGTLPYPHWFGVILIVFAIIGHLGLATHQNGLLATFAAGSFVLRFWMATMYFITDWRDQTWGSYAVGALICAWIFARILCDVAAKRPFRVLRFHQALCRKFGVETHILESREYKFERV